MLSNFRDYMNSALFDEEQLLARRSHNTAVKDPGLVDLFCTKTGSTYCASEVMSNSEIEALEDLDGSDLTSDLFDVRECGLGISFIL